MPAVIVPKASLMAQLTALKTPLLNTGEMRLFTGSLIPNVDTVIGDFVEATFTGYAPVTLTAWGTAYLTPGKRGAINSPPANFAAASPFTIQEIVTGYYVLDANGDLLCSGNFETPISFGAAGNAAEVIVQYLWGNP